MSVQDLLVAAPLCANAADHDEQPRADACHGFDSSAELSDEVTR